jgi:hypothetical protein
MHMAQKESKCFSGGWLEFQENHDDDTFQNTAHLSIGKETEPCVKAIDIINLPSSLYETRKWCKNLSIKECIYTKG